MSLSPKNYSLKPSSIIGFLLDGFRLLKIHKKLLNFQVIQDLNLSGEKCPTSVFVPSFFKTDEKERNLMVYCSTNLSSVHICTLERVLRQELE